MIESVSLNSLVENNGKLDIYGFLRSKEIQDYMRQNVTFSLKEKIFIILNSFNPYSLKLEALKILSQDKELSEDEKRHILYTIRYLERILQEIYSPESSVIFAMTECYTAENKELNEYEASIKNNSLTWYYMSYQEFLDIHKDYMPKDNERLPRYEFDLVYPVKTWLENTPIGFSATWIDDNIEIYSISADDKWGKTQSFKSSITEYFECGKIGHFRLPFPNGSKIKLQTPFMKTPLIGTLDSSGDEYNCWYHFFYLEDTRGMCCECMDLYYQEIDLCDTFTVYDWVSSVELSH